MSLMYRGTVTLCIVVTLIVCGKSIEISPIVPSKAFKAQEHTVHYNCLTTCRPSSFKSKHNIEGCFWEPSS